MASAKEFKDTGNDHFKNGRFAQAIEAYSQSIELDPTEHTVFSNRSAAYLKSGSKNSEALADAEHCVKLAPAWAKGHSRMAACLLAMGRYEEARVACDAGLAVASEDSKEILLQTQKASVNQGFSSKLKGKWHGSVSDELGGYVQEFDFLNHKDVMVFVMGHSYPGTFVVDASQSPVNIDIQVIPPDAPPGYAPPPVPHIVRFIDPGSLELCCPYMTQARPAQFDGPGYCVLKQGGMASAGADESIKGLSVDEKKLQCAEATFKMMPDTAMEQPSQFDTEEVAASKMLAQVKFQSTIYKLESKFGEDTFRQVMTDASEPMSSNGAYGDAIRKLREKIIETKLMDVDKAAAESATQAKAREQSAAVGSSGPRSLGPKAETKEKDAPADAPSESTEGPAVPPLDAAAPYLLGTVVVLGAAALVFAWMRRHKS